MMRGFSALVAAAALFLGGCSGGSDTSSSQASQISSIVNVLRASRAAAVPLPALTPALIDSLTIPALEVTLESRGQTAYLYPVAQRRDAGPGTLQTWRTGDNSQVTFRDGVLVTTRGLGDDLGSTQADAAVRAIAARSPVSGPHTLYVSNGNNGIDRIDLLCEMRTVGTETIEIVERRFDVVHLQENCTGARGIITYDYWVDRRDSTVWQSRQWAGTRLGYVRTRLLNR